jgi:uncharacterized membrane protein
MFLPPVIIAATLFYLIKNSLITTRLFNLMFGYVLIISGACAYILINMQYHASYDDVFKIPVNFTMRGINTLLIAATGFLLYFTARPSIQDKIIPWAKFLLIIAAARYIYFEGMLHNLLFTHDQNVGEAFIVNGLLTTFAVGAAFWIFFGKIFQGSRPFAGFMTLLFMFAFVTYTVRHYYHGGNLQLHQLNMTPAELYSYSVVWLLYGIVLLTAGIVWRHHALRMGAMAFILLAILKVFLHDAAALEGLYRIFSFLGLGVSLIGLSIFYTRFISRAQR